MYKRGTINIIEILPSNNVTVSSDKFIEIVLSKLKSKDIVNTEKKVNITEDFLNLCRTVHSEFTEEEYKKIRLEHKTRYSIWKDNAAFLNKVICSSNDKLKDYNKAIEIISIKDSVINNTISNILNNYKTLDECKTETERMIEAGEIIDKIKKEFIKRTMQYRGSNGNHLFDSYFITYIHDGVIITEILAAVQKVGLAKTAFQEKEHRSQYYKYEYVYKNKPTLESVKALRWQ